MEDAVGIASGLLDSKTNGTPGAIGWPERRPRLLSILMDINGKT